MFWVRTLTSVPSMSSLLSRAVVTAAVRAASGRVVSITGAQLLAAMRQHAKTARISIDRMVATAVPSAEARFWRENASSDTDDVIPAVYHEHLARNGTRGIAQQEDCGVCDLAQLHAAAERCTLALRLQHRRQPGNPR